MFRKCREMAMPLSRQVVSCALLMNMAGAAYEGRAVEYTSIPGSVGDVHELDRLRIEQDGTSVATRLRVLSHRLLGKLPNPRMQTTLEILKSSHAWNSSGQTVRDH